MQVQKAKESAVAAASNDSWYQDCISTWNGDVDQGEKPLQGCCSTAPPAAELWVVAAAAAHPHSPLAAIVPQSETAAVAFEPRNKPPRDAKPDMAFAAGCSRCLAPPSQSDGPRATPWEPRGGRCVAPRASPPAVAAVAAGGGAVSGEQAAGLPRRSTLLAALQAATLLLVRPAAAEQEDTLTVGAGKQFATIGAALAKAGSGATIVVSGGR